MYSVGTKSGTNTAATERNPNLAHINHPSSISRGWSVNVPKGYTSLHTYTTHVPKRVHVAWVSVNLAVPGRANAVVAAKSDAYTCQISLSGSPGVCAGEVPTYIRPEHSQLDPVSESKRVQPDQSQTSHQSEEPESKDSRFTANGAIS